MHEVPVFRQRGNVIGWKRSRVQTEYSISHRSCAVETQCEQVGCDVICTLRNMRCLPSGGNQGGTADISSLIRSDERIRDFYFDKFPSLFSQQETKKKEK